jgi:hypothetical protein
LVEYALESARGMSVLRAQGLEAESQLAFSGLAELLGPVLDRLKNLARAQSAALRGALGLTRPAPGDRFVIYVAVLGLLAAVAEKKAGRVASQGLVDSYIHGGGRIGGHPAAANAKIEQHGNVGKIVVLCPHCPVPRFEPLLQVHHRDLTQGNAEAAARETL